MRTLIVMLMLVSLMFAQIACSVAWALKQPAPADLTGIGVGTPRQQVIDRLGIPKLSETDSQGKKRDSFEFQSGMHHASRLRAIPYLAADVFSLGLAEALLWPLELTVMKDASCNAHATYDSNEIVETWQVHKLSGVQDC